jgi:hypothetical protein
MVCRVERDVVGAEPGGAERLVHGRAHLRHEDCQPARLGRSVQARQLRDGGQQHELAVLPRVLHLLLLLLGSLAACWPRWDCSLGALRQRRHRDQARELNALGRRALRTVAHGRRVEGGHHAAARGRIGSRCASGGNKAGRLALRRRCASAARAALRAARTHKFKNVSCTKVPQDHTAATPASSGEDGTGAGSGAAAACPALVPRRRPRAARSPVDGPGSRRFIAAAPSCQEGGRCGAARTHYRGP